MREVLALLKKRLVEEPVPVDDLRFAIDTLRECGTPKLTPERRSMLEDLKKKADEATASLDPKHVAGLVEALNAFISEEMGDFNTDDDPKGGSDMLDEEKKDEELAQATEAEDETAEEEELEPVEEADGDDAVTPEPDEESELDVDSEDLQEEGEEGHEEPDGDEGPNEVVCEACGHRMKLQEMGATTGSAPAPMGEADEEEAPAEEEEEEPVELFEVRRRKEAEQRMRRQKLTESERAELVALRAEKRERTVLTKAAKEIRKHGVMLDARELASFREAQWPAIIRMAKASQPSYGPGERVYVNLRESKQNQKPASARDVFERSLRQLGH